MKSEELRNRMIGSIEKYVSSETKAMKLSAREANIIRAAMLGGISITSYFLTATDGSDEVTPHLISKAANETTQYYGFAKGILKS